MLAVVSAGQTVLLRQLITIFRTTYLDQLISVLIDFFRTASRQNFQSVESFIIEPDSRAQCAALEDNVKEFGLTYFGMRDRRQGN